MALARSYAAIQSGWTAASAITGDAKRPIRSRPAGSSQALRNDATGGGAQCQSLAAGPLIASSSAAASRTVRASGPLTASPLISEEIGALDTRPRDGLM